MTGLSRIRVEVVGKSISQDIWQLAKQGYSWPSLGTVPDSSPVVSKLSLLINYLLGKSLGYARGEDGKARRGETTGRSRFHYGGLYSVSLLPSRHPLRWRTRSSLPRQMLIMRDNWGRVRNRTPSLALLGHPTTVSCKISVWRGKYCIEFSITRGRLKKLLDDRSIHE